MVINMCFPIHGSRVLTIFLFCTTYCLQPNNFIGENVPKAPNLIGYMWENMWRLKVTSMFKNIQRSVFVVLLRIRKTANYFLQLKNILFFFIRFVLYIHDTIPWGPQHALSAILHTYVEKSDSLTSRWVAKLIATRLVAQGGGGEGGENRFTVFIDAHCLLCNQWTIVQKWFTARLKGPPEPS